MQRCRKLQKNVLEKLGYNVITASNGLAALTCDDLENVDLVIIDTDLRDMNGFETVEHLRNDPENFPIPVLLLVPDERIDSRTSINLKGANAYLIKPFEPKMLLANVKDLLQEKGIFLRSQQHIRDAAEKFVSQLAENEIQNAIDRRTQLIVERVIQNVSTAVEQRARREVDTKVTSLVSDKEQELVRITVNEVAHSMVEKLAERKVTEAMETILEHETEKVVKRSADIILPNVVRDKVKESLEHTLPREVQNRVQRAAEQLVPDVSNKIIAMIETVAHRIVPKVGKEKLPEVVEKQAKMYISQDVPRLVSELVRKEFRHLCDVELAAIIGDATRKTWIRLFIVNGVMITLVIVALIAGYFFLRK